jgi:Mg-chelatase subunit ChlD
LLHFRYPELFLLAVPVAWAFWRWGRLRGVTGWIRGLIALLLVFALTGPELRTGGRGTDVIVVADRSRSMTSASTRNMRELIANLDRNRRPGDRVGIVTFGGGSQIERVLSESATLGEFTKQVSPDGSDLNEALERALTLAQKDRPARILVLSDGESNGSNPLTAARRAREEGVPIDARSFSRPRIGDTAIEAVLLPEEVAPREPFQFSTVLTSDGDRDGTVVVKRSGREISKRDVHLLAGRNRVVFRDVIDEAGFVGYSVELTVANDPQLANNRGAGAVRVDAGPRLLVLNSDGNDDNLVRAVRAAKVPVDVAAAAAHPLTQDSLDPYRAVILENVPAESFGRIKMERLAQFVEDLGGGLLVTGGRQSFGVGGYFNSPLDPVLPVSMELREEHRKNRVAIAVALDRSGSMTMPVKGSLNKMDLANLGTAEVIKLLSPGDKIAVIAVDSSPHVIEPLGDVKNRDEMISRVKSIQSEGGGIFVYEALVAAGNELLNANDYTTRHIILFSDAADSEEPGDYKKLLAEYASAGITVSVIGLGTTADPDAALLEDIASLGKGNIMFSNDAEELPRLFTQDTMSVARNTFLTGDGATIPGQLVPDARLMGELGTGILPDVGGYNLSYLKPQATLAAVSRDEYAAPWSAVWYRGLGRAAAVTFEADGPFTGPIGEWAGYEDFFVTHARWLLGGEKPGEVFVTADRNGLEATVSVELDREAAQQSVPELVVVPPDTERTASITPDLIWTGPTTLEARFRLAKDGTYRTLVKTSGREFTRGPAITLPYSPEFMPRLGLPTGERTLKDVAELSGGKMRTDVLGVFADPPPSRRLMPLLPWIVATTVVLLLTEIAGRRLSLWEKLPFMTDEVPDAEHGSARSRRRWFEIPQRARRRPAGVARPAAVSERSVPAPGAAPAAAPTLGDVLAKAKQRAKR